MIKITDKAAIKLKELRKSENYPLDFDIRVKVKGGGCSGLLYDLKFDNNISDQDQTFEDNGTKIANYRGIGLSDMIDAIDNNRQARCSLDLAVHVPT